MKYFLTILIFLHLSISYGQKDSIEKKLEHIEKHLYQAKRITFKAPIKLESEELEGKELLTGLRFQKTKHWNARFEIINVSFVIKDTSFYSDYYFWNDSLIYVYKSKNYSSREINSLELSYETNQFYIDNGLVFYHVKNKSSSITETSKINPIIGSMILNDSKYYKELKQK